MGVCLRRHPRALYPQHLYAQQSSVTLSTMANRTSSKPLRIMTNTSGSLGWLAACAIGGNILALIDRTPNGRSHTAILPVLLDPLGQLLHVAQDLNVDNPRFADIVQTGQDEALIAVMSRPDGSGPLAIPHFYRCSIKPGQLRVKKLGVWRGGTSILSTSLFLRHNDRLGFACLFAKSVRQERQARAHPRLGARLRHNRQ